MATVKEDVAIRLAARASSVRETIIESLVEEQLKAQVAATTNVMRLIEVARIDVLKIKPTIPGYNLSGDPLPAIWTKEQLDQKKAAEEKLAALEQALNEAIGDGIVSNPNDVLSVPNFTKVLKLGKAKE